MNWTIFFDILFALGALAGAGFLVYGGWLSCIAPKVTPLIERAKTLGHSGVSKDAASVEFASSGASSLLS